MSRQVIGTDFVLYTGEVLDMLAELRDESVDCVVTSPPYWGLRDYGTGEWDGGDLFCDHAPVNGAQGETGQRATRTFTGATPQRDTCTRCGATRVDRQLGLEASPDRYVERLVEVFAEIRRVLAPHGTVWLNLGDTYAGSGGYANTSNGLATAAEASDGVARARSGPREHRRPGNPAKNRGASNRDGVGAVPGIKPKDLIGIPWRVAFALQAAGWYLRADVIWSKPNPMPESVTDRPTKAHEYVFMLTKRGRYTFDQDAVAEPAVEGTDLGLLRSRKAVDGQGPTDRASIDKRLDAGIDSRNGNPSATRNVRTVWTIPTAPYAEAHFATYPPELVRRCLKAGCPKYVCQVCGRPRERIVERTPATPTITPTLAAGEVRPRRAGFYDADQRTIGWTDCGHNQWRRGVVLDPFIGSGTTALVARELELNCVGIELNPIYAALTAKRLQQLSLLSLLPPEPEAVA